MSIKGLQCFFPVILFIGTIVLADSQVDAEENQVSFIQHERIKGELELAVENQTNEQGASGNTRKSETMVFEERMKLNTTGSIYHPNFLFFDTSVGVGLNQQSLDSDDGSDHVSDTFPEYSLAAQLLRVKKYPITFYTNKSEDLISRHFLGPLRSETENSGFSLAYRSETSPMKFQYSRTKTTQDSFVSTARDYFLRDDKRFTYTLDYNISEQSHMSFQYEHNDFSQNRFNASTNTKEDRTKFLHDIVFGSDEQYRLDSYATYLKQTGSVSLDTLQGEERFRIRHRENLSTFYELGVSDSKFDTTTNQEMRGRAGFEHSLYESLFTTGNLFATETDLDEQGNISQQGGLLGTNYRKNNPWGTLLCSYSATYIETDQSGGSGIGNIINERHSYNALDPAPIELNKNNIDLTTIVVWDNNRTTRYIENIDYEVTVLFDKVQISIITGGDIFLGGSQTLSFDYKYSVEPKRNEEQWRQDFTLRQRFDNGFSLFYAHHRQDENVRSRLGNITPDEFRENVYGTEYTKKGLSLLAEYSQEDATQVSSTRKRLTASYNWALTDNTRATVQASNYWLEYKAPDNRDIELLNLGTKITSRLTQKYNITAQIDYRNEDDSVFGNTEGFDVRTELQYKFRQLSFNVGFELDFLNRREIENNNTFTYFRITRYF